ncbi:MAG: alternative ribosome rescue aminoacyl-tRNA hydrolase ArfB [Acidimicrobiia bacterium]|jgi:ribosome-associated protein
MDGLDIGRYTIPAEELEEMFETSGGPGGQHANRSATAVRLRFDVSASSLPEEVRNRLTDRLGAVVEVTASQSRSQFRNRALARQRMREKLEKAMKPKPKRRPTKPTRASKRRRIVDKRARGEKKRLRQPPQIDD